MESWKMSLPGGCGGRNGALSPELRATVITDEGVVTLTENTRDQALLAMKNVKDFDGRLLVEDPNIIWIFTSQIKEVI